MKLRRKIVVDARIGASLLCTGALLLVLGAPAGAAGPGKREQAKAAVEKGETAYKLGRFEEALEDYSHAYELFPAPALLFNLGQCHKQLKNHERAIFFFEGYLRDEPRPTNRRLVQDLIAESRAELDKQKAASASPAPPPEPSPAPPEKSAEATQALASAPPTLHAPAAPKAQLVLISAPAAARQPDISPTSPQPTRWWLWAAIAAGVLAAGAVAYYETGAPRTVVPGGTLGTIDRR